MIYRFSLIEKILLAKDIIPHPFGDASFSVGLGFALGISVKLKIVDQLSYAYRDVGSIANASQVSEIGATLILDCLDALGYVHKKNSKYAFSKRGFKCLSAQSPNNLRHFILFCDYLYQGYIHLGETIRQGKSYQADKLQTMSEYEWELFSRAMIDISKTNYKEVVGKIPVAKTASKILDLGGSHGLYSIELCNRYPQLKATIVDLPPVKKYADETIHQHQAGERVGFLPADFMKEEIPKNVDIILAFNIIHGLNPTENLLLAKKVFSSLNYGGIFVILDQIKGIGGNSQMSKATTSYMALNLLHEAGGRTYSETEVDAIVKQSGFKSTVLKKIHAPGFGIIICNK
ncbi:MAG TPA: methyltransferase [Niabella sp.]|nr:methyltransferase [Niabella sp.]HOZ97413.1 methyltransferase [Niabella sp.]HQW15219.1 methyltransferase [Niabella sp.]HQX20313.1 methyltransferase [Niabella sp.]HQX42307.1 methyltransferase [Niabella sp.]